MPILLEDILKLVYPAFDPHETKLHLAQYDGVKDPLDEYLKGDFERWQAKQRRREFKRSHVAALIQTDEKDIWLFAGIWKRTGDPERGIADGYEDKGPIWIYPPMEPVAETEPLAGRLYVRHVKESRTTYRKMEELVGEIEVSSITEQPRELERFPGYRKICIPFWKLRRLVRRTPEDWRIALSAVGGVYLITTPDGAQYVGSATGTGGFWQRWQEYARTGHGDNVKLRKLLGSDPTPASAEFTLSVLETADTTATQDEVRDREAHWKQVLGTRSFGLNLN